MKTLNVKLTLVNFKVVNEENEIMAYVSIGNNEPIWYTEKYFEEKFGIKMIELLNA